MFSIVFQKLALFLNLKKLIFSKIISFFAFFLSSVFISMYGFSQTFWLNWMILCNFFSILIHYSMPQFFMCTAYSFWLCKLDTSFLTFSIFVIFLVCAVPLYLLYNDNGLCFYNNYSVAWMSRNSLLEAGAKSEV